MRKFYVPIFFVLFFLSVSAFANNPAYSFLTEVAGYIPSATIEGTTAVCQGSGPQQITFTGTGGTAPYTFTYKINNGATNHTVTTASGSSVTVNLSSDTAGTFIYTLESVIDSATDAVQHTVTGSATITVNALPEITGDSALCVGTTTNLDGSGTQAANPAWSSSNPAVATVNNSGVVDAHTPGTTTITYTNSNGCHITKVITVHSLPVANFTFDNNNSCSGTNIGFTPSVTGGQGSYTYSWIFGDGGTSTSSSPNHKFTSYGCATETFQVILTVTDANGCIDTVSKNVTVKQKPHAALEDQNIFSPFSNCENNPSLENSEFTITVNNVSTDPGCTTSYTLNWGDGAVLTNLTVASFPLTHTYSDLGVFNLTLTALGNNGCNNTVVYPVANQSNPAGSLGTLGSTTGLCAPATVPFTIGNWELNSPGTSYILNFGDGSSVTLEHPLTSNTVYHTYETSSCPTPSFTATLMVVNLCDETPYTAGNIQVRIKPHVAFTAPEAACSTQEVCFVNETVVGSTGSTCNNLTAYQWNFGDPTSPTNTINVNTTGTPQGCHTFSGPGTYTVTLSATNPCGTHSYSQDICIEAPLSAPSFTLSNTTGCAPFAVTATNTSNVSGSCDPIYQWSVSNYSATNCGTAPASNYNYFTNGTTASSVNPSFNFPNAGTYTIRLRVTNTCGTVTTTQTVVVKRPPTVTINPVTDLCGADQVTFTPQLTLTNCGSDPLTYMWSFPGGTPSTSTDPQPSVIYTTPGNHTLSVEVTNECGSTSDTETFSISPTVLTDAGDDITICNGTSTQLNGQASGGVPGYTYQWSPSAGLSSTTIANPVANPTTTTTYTLTVRDSQNCPKSSQVTVAINTLNQGSIGNGQTICSGGDPVAFTSGAASGTGTLTYQWERSTTGADGTYTDIPGATDAVYDSPPLTQNTWFRRKVTSTLNGVACENTTNFVEVIINDVNEGAIEGDRQICTGGSPEAFTEITPASGTGTLTYQWQSSVDNISWTGISGATNPTYSSGPLTQTTYFRRRVTSSLNGVFCSAFSNFVTVTVVPDPEIITQPLATQTVCLGAPVASLNVAASGGMGAFSYQWYSNAANSNTGGVPIPGQENNNLTPVPAAAGTYYYYVEVTTDGAGCSVTSAVAQVIVMPAPEITNEPVSSSVCEGGTPALLAVAHANGIGAPTYQWYSNTTNSNSGGTAITTATGSSYQPDGNVVGTTYYYVVLTFTSGGCSTITSQVATVEVTPAPHVNQQPTASQDICAGGSIAALSVGYSGGSGTPSYQWYSNTTASNAGGTLIPSATAATYTPPVFNTVGTYYYYATITLSAGGCPPVTSEVAQVNVVADPVVDTQPLATQTLCQDSTPAGLTVAVSGGVGAPQYQWYSNTVNSTTGGTLLTDETDATLEPPTSAVGTMYYYVVVTTPASGCSVTSNTSAVIVIDSPIFTTQPQDETLCHGETPAQLSVAYANGTGTASYQWYSNTVDSADTATATLIPGAEAATYQPSSDDADTLYYFATINFSSGGCLVITSATAQVTINALPQITTPQADSVCSNEAVAYAPANGGGNSIPAGTQYTWTAPSGTGFTGGTAQTVPQAGVLQTLTNTTNAPVTATYTVTPISNGCSGTPFILIITVRPEPQIPAVIRAICSEGSFTVNPQTVTGAIVPAGVIYTWDAPVVTGGMTGGQSGTTQPEIGGTLVNPTDTAQTATYTVNIVSPPGVCAGDPFTITVTVNPTPHVDATQTATICSSGTFAITPTNADGNIIPANTTYTWGDPVISPAGAITGGSAQATPQTSIAQALVNTTVNIATATYTVTPNSGSCPGNTFEVVVTVNPVPTVDDVIAQTLCGGSATTAVNFTGATAGTVYNWTNNTASIGLGTSGQGNIPSFVAVNGGINPVTATITVTPVFDGCPGAPKSFTITVNPAPMVNFSISDQAICSGTASAAVTLTSATPGASIAWTAVQPAGITGVAVSGTTSILAQTLTNTTSSPITITYTAVAATADASACPGPVATYTIVVNPVPFVGAPIAEAICSGSTVTVLPSAGAPNNIPAGTTFTWAAPTGTGFTGGTAQSAPQPSFNQTLVNTTTAPVTATYTVTPSANGCTGVPFQIAVTVNPTATIGNAAQTICTGGSFSINPAANATLLPLGTVYNWSAPTVTGGITGGIAGSGQTLVTGTLVNPSAGMQTATYVVTPVSPDGNCAGNTFNVVITVSSSFSVASVVSDYNGFEISVAGGTDGSIDLTPTGGSGSYAYAWSGPGGFAATTQDIANLGQGNYTVTISDGLCADVVLQFQLVEPLPLVIAEVIPSHVNVNCFGESTGVIEVAITEVSVGPFDYAILLANGTLVEDELNTLAENHVFDNLPAGTYNIRVTDANGTMKFINGIVITQPAAELAISNSVVSNFNGFNISCNGASNAGIDITVTGGTPGYSYAWTGPNGFAATTQDIASLAPGNYTVIITDSTGVCTVTQTYTITEPVPLALSSMVSDFNGFEIACFGGTSGSINVTPSGGTGTYNYQWAGPNGFVATTQDVANLAVGTYTLTMTDSNNCALAVQTYTLDQPAAIIATETHVNVLCFGTSTGSIDVTVAGGVTSVSGGYSFAWTGPNSFLATTEDLNNIAAGTYHLTITDDSGCTRTLVVMVTQQPEIIITPTNTPISCYGANDASITLNIIGGDAPYVAEWSNLAVGTFQDNLAAGNYVITVTDDSGCQKQITVVINEAPIFTINPVVTQITCNGANDGSIALNLVGGQAPVTMTWSDGSVAGTTRNNLGPGTYTATIFDGTPCQIVRTFTIIEPLTLNIGANVTHATVCDNAQSGAINLHPGGGVPPYTFAWSNGATTEDLTGLTSGTYIVTVTDANGCSKTMQYAVTRPDALSLTVNQNVQFNCDAHTVTQTNIAQASGGLPPFTYTWSAGTVSGGNGQMMTTNVNGTYIATVTDAMGCSVNFTFEVDTQQLGEADFYVESYAHTTFGVYSIFDPIQFTNTSTGDYIGVSWNFGDGSVSDEENPGHTYVREGVYTVLQTVTYPYGCVDKRLNIINVGKGYDVMIPNAFTPNADGTNDTFAAVFKGLKSIELAVYDTWGSMIYYEKGDVIQGWNGMINGVPAENGNYVYRITAETFYGQLVNYEGPFALIK